MGREHIASAVIVMDEKDERFLAECLLSLPEWVRPVVMRTKYREGAEEQFSALREDDRASVYEYIYGGVFDFARARNLAKLNVETPWIISLDADERLDVNQHDYLRKLLLQTEDAVGGYMATSWSAFSSYRDEKNPSVNMRLAVPTVRIFKNIPAFQWRYPIHEVIDPSIIESGYLILDTKINILHEGYWAPKEVLMEKLERNIKVLLAHPELFEEERYKNYFLSSFEMLNKLRRS